MSLPPTQPWVVVMPVKAGTAAKSRLSDFSAAGRVGLALAFAADTASAALAAPGVTAVLTVTDDEAAAHLLAQIGCHTVADEPRAGLNAAVQHGVDAARLGWPGCWSAVLPSDLPALRPADLSQALASAEEHRRAFVPDATGVGTNLLTAAPDTVLDPRFEGSSCEAHAASGAVRLDLDVTSLRRDVDHAADLRAARTRGLGPATLGVLDGLLGTPGDYDHGMQATVASYDEHSRSGTVLADDGVAHSFTAAALEGTRLRFLRPGQRVRVSVGVDGGVEALQIVTLPG